MKAVLWDVDGTLLDFLTAEKAAIQALFRKYFFRDCPDESIARYSVINRGYWEKLERYEMTKSEILVKRFEDFFAQEGLDVSRAAAFNAEYQIALGDTVAYCDNSLELVRSLHGKVKQYVISNGTVIAQTKKLKNSGFDKWVDGVFLSEYLGYEKPDERFFDAVLEDIAPLTRDDCLIVGDSLTSDMEGGRRAGICTVWYNPERKAKKADVPTNYEIHDLHEIVGILKEKQFIGK